MAGIGVGIYIDQMDASKRIYKIQSRYVPNPENRAIYDKLYAVYKKLYTTLLDVHTALIEIERGIQQ